MGNYKYYPFLPAFIEGGEGLMDVLMLKLWGNVAAASKGDDLAAAVPLLRKTSHSSDDELAQADFDLSTKRGTIFSFLYIVRVFLNRCFETLKINFITNTIVQVG